MTKLTHINLSDLDLPEFEAHNDIPEHQLKEISESIKEIGVLEPLIVRKHNKRFEIVVGCVRFRAARLAGLKAVPCITVSINDKQAEIIKAHENLKRIPLNHVDQGHTFVMMMDKFKMTELAISEIIGKSISYISNHIKLVTQDSDLATAVKNNIISFSQARELLNIKDIPTRRQLQSYCERDGATIQVLKSWIKEHNDSLQIKPTSESDTPAALFQYSKPSNTRTCEACLKPMPISDMRQLIMCSTCAQAIKQAISEQLSKPNSETPEET